MIIEERKCQVCNKPLGNQVIDGRTIMGPWGYMCLACHKKVGVGLGVGKGQHYKLDESTMEYIKVS